MKEIKVRYEPLWSVLILLGLFWLIRLVSDEPGKIITLLLILGIEVVFIILHFIFRRKVLATISEDGIKFNDGRLVFWESIHSWRYLSGSRLIFENRIEFASEWGPYKLEGVNALLILKHFIKFLPGKCSNYVKFVATYFVVIGFFIFIFISALKNG